MGNIGPTSRAERTMKAESVRFQIKIGGVSIGWFIRHPIDVPAPEGEMGFVNNAERKCAAKVVNGEWRQINGARLTFVPTHWTEFGQVKGD